MTGPPPARIGLDQRRASADGRGDDVVAVDRDVADAVARGPLLERRRVLGRRPARTRRSRCSRRRTPPAAATPRRGSPPRGTRPGRPRRRRRTPPPRLPSARSCARGRRADRDREAGGHDAVGAEDPDASGRRCASSRPGPGSCPRPCAISSANIPSGSRPLARQWPWPRWVEVMTSVGRERPARADRRRLLPDREVDEAGHLAVAVQRGDPLLEAADHQHPAVHLERGRPSRGGGQRPTSMAVYCTGRYKTGKADGGADRHPRVVPRRRRRARASGWCSPAPAAASAGCSPTRSPTPAPGGAGRPHRGRPQGGRRRAPGPVARAAAATCTDATSTTRSPTPPWPSGAASTCGSATPGSRPIVAGPLGTPTRRSGARCSRSTSPAPSSAPAPPPGVMGDGGRLIFTGSVLGERPGQGPRRVQRLEGRAGRPGQGRSRSTWPPSGITVNVVAPGWFDSPLADGWKSNPTLEAGDPRPHRAAALGRRRPTWPAPTSSWPRTRRRSSPAPSSTSTAGTCSS